MRLSEAAVSAATAEETLRAAKEAGVTLFDTAAAYGRTPKDLHQNEALLRRVLGEMQGLTVVTKCGMLRTAMGGRVGWRPDGRRKTILAHASKSRDALGRAPDVLLLHAPDRQTTFSTSIRALGTAKKEGLTRSIGLSNVRLDQLREAMALEDIAMVEVALSPFDDTAARNGVVEHCLAHGLTVLAHSPLGGPKRWKRLGQNEDLRFVAEQRGVSPQTIVLAWLYSLHPLLVPLPGARRPETARWAAEAAALDLRDDERALLDEQYPLGRLVREPRLERAVRTTKREVVLTVGVQGAGKSTRAKALTAEGFVRLSRDDRGGSLNQLAQTMTDELEEGTTRILMDATYPSRAQRSVAMEAAWAAGASVRCVFFDTPRADAEINVIDRMVAAHGRLPSPDEIKKLSKQDPRFIPPVAQRSFYDHFEPPTEAEGFTEIETVPFERIDPGHHHAGLAVSLDALVAPSWPKGVVRQARIDALRAQDAKVLIFGWRPGLAEVDQQRAIDATFRDLEVVICPHEAGPQKCWCRPPLPGLLVPWMRTAEVAPGKLTLVGGDVAAGLAERLSASHAPASSLDPSSG